MPSHNNTHPKKPLPPDRHWTFEYRAEGNPIDNMVRLVRLIFEGTFKGKALFEILLFLFLFGVILSLIFWIFFT